LALFGVSFACSVFEPVAFAGNIDKVRYVADRWRMDYNHYRPHSNLDYMAPVVFAATVAKILRGPQP